MNYYIKIGEMYVRDLFLDDRATKSEFIRGIDFKYQKDNCMIICKEQIPFYAEKLKKIFNISGNDSINFEKEELEELEYEETK